MKIGGIMGMNYIEQHYDNYDEDSRLLSKHGRVEYLTTLKYIEAILGELDSPKILEVGAGTGRYSIYLAKKGYDISALELSNRNLEVLKSKITDDMIIKASKGNALDLSAYQEESFDMTLVLGPMYHLFSKEDKVLALKEAVRVTKKNGYILVAYCMNEPTVIDYIFKGQNLNKILENNMITEDWHCISTEKDIIAMIRLEEINEINESIPAVRIKIVATDGATNYMRDFIDQMDAFTFDKWMEYHFTICERLDLIGASHHTLDILKKNE